MSEKYNKKGRPLYYFEHFFIFVSLVSGCISVSAFSSLFVVPVVIASSAVGLKICAITTEIKKYQSIIKKSRKNHGKLVLLDKNQLNTIEVLISNRLIY